MKKLIIAFVLCASPAFATELPVPKLKPQEPSAKEACMARIRAQCAGTHRTKLFTKACVFRNRYQCREMK